jgi:large subunit ribosomal protein L20
LDRQDKCCCQDGGFSYSKLIHALASKNIILNRKVLADLAMNHPDAFKAVVAQVK